MKVDAYTWETWNSDDMVQITVDRDALLLLIRNWESAIKSATDDDKFDEAYSLLKDYKRMKNLLDKAPAVEMFGDNNG